MSLDEFLASVERSGFRIAQLATRNEADALDILQDAMTKLVNHYRYKPPEQWGPLFHTILQRRITDWHRAQTRQHRFFWWHNKASEESKEEGEQDWIETYSANKTSAPQTLLERQATTEEILAAFEQLPLRQQQAFILRAWEGYDVKTTATIMNCSQGSVKTHYSRALHQLRHLLEGIDHAN